jgi:hypothetical protein
MLVLPLLVATLPSLATAFPSTAHRLKERVHAPLGWIRLDNAPADHIIPLRIALPQSNFDELERHLYEVSDPSHARYGAHLSKEEVEGLVAPHPESLTVVNGWLASHGFDDEDLQRSAAGDWVTVRVPVALAEEMLDTVRSLYRFRRHHMAPRLESVHRAHRSLRLATTEISHVETHARRRRNRRHCRVLPAGTCARPHRACATYDILSPQPPAPDDIPFCGGRSCGGQLRCGIREDCDSWNEYHG